MSTPARIVDGHGSGVELKIGGEGEIGIVSHSHPPIDEEISSYPFSQFFTDDGTPDGSEDMRVDGSTTPQEFYIQARSDVDVYIKTISVRISDASAVLNKYGNLTALTNGVTWKFVTNVLGEITIKDSIKTNLDFIRVGLSTPPIGGTDAFKADLSGGGADTYIVVIDMTQTFGFPWGIRLEKGSNDKMVFVINDNLSTGMDGHDIFGFGIQL